MILCRATVNLVGAPQDTEVWIDPTQPWVQPYLEKKLLVQIPEPQEPADAPASPDPGEVEPAEPLELLEAPDVPERQPADAPDPVDTPLPSVGLPPLSTSG